MSNEAGSLEALLHEDRRFAPPEGFRARAVVSDPGIYRRAEADREAYWAEWARELDYRLIKELWAFDGARIVVIADFVFTTTAVVAQRRRSFMGAASHDRRSSWRHGRRSEGLRVVLALAEHGHVGAEVRREGPVVLLAGRCADPGPGGVVAGGHRAFPCHRLIASSSLRNRLENT